MTTWQTIFSVEPPIEEEPSDVDAVITEFQDRQTKAQAIVTRFATIQSGGVEGHLEGDVGPAFYEVVKQVHSGLSDLPRIAGEAADILAQHKADLEKLRTESDEALARATVSWTKLKDAKDELSADEARVRGLQDQVDSSADAADNGPSEDQIDRLNGTISGHNSSIARYERELKAICTGFGSFDGASMAASGASEYSGFVRRVEDLDDGTESKLKGISRGDLDDPNWFQKVGSAVCGFVVGVLESVVNLLEAFATGDWATFFWELRNLLNAALLILGTIALFTGVGAPLFFLSVAAFAVTTGLYVTQTPNPQTGETMGLTDVLISGAGVAFSAAGAVRGMGTNGTKLFTGVKNAQGQMNGGLFSTARNLKALTGVRSAVNTPAAIKTALKMGTYTSPIAQKASVAWTAGRVTFGARGTIAKIQNIGDIDLGPVDTITGAKGMDAYRNGAGTPAFRVANAPDWGAMIKPADDPGGYNNPGTQGTPVFAPKFGQVEAVQRQLADAPNVTVIGVR